MALKLRIIGDMQASAEHIEECGWAQAETPEGLFVAYDQYPPEELPSSVKVMGTNCSTPRWVDKRVPVVTTRHPEIMKQMPFITATSEFVIGQIMYLQRPMIKAGCAPWGDRNRFISPQMLSKQTALVIGLGRIGSAVATVLEAMGMLVVSVDKTPDLETERRVLTGLVPMADVVVMTAHTDRAILDSELCVLLKNTAIVVSISHPRAICLDTCIFRLLHDTLRGVACDDHDLPIQYSEIVGQLVIEGKLLLTPHIAGSTLDARVATEKMVLREMRKVCDG